MRRNCYFLKSARSMVSTCFKYYSAWILYYSIKIPCYSACMDIVPLISPEVSTLYIGTLNSDSSVNEFAYFLQVFPMI